MTEYCVTTRRCEPPAITSSAETLSLAVQKNAQTKYANARWSNFLGISDLFNFRAQRVGSGTTGLQGRFARTLLYYHRIAVQELNGLAIPILSPSFTHTALALRPRRGILTARDDFHCRCE